MNTKVINVLKDHLFLINQIFLVDGIKSIIEKNNVDALTKLPSIIIKAIVV